GDQQRHAGQCEKALESYARALELTAQEPRDPNQARTRILERDAHEGRARALEHLKRPSEAAAEWEEVVRRTDDGRAEPGIGRALSLAKAGDHASAMKELEDLDRGQTSDGARLYELACVASLSSAAARRAGEADRAERYAVAAVALLRRAWKAKLFTDAVY